MSSETKLKITEHPQYDASTGFDYRVHIKDAKTGKVIRLQHYARHTNGTAVLLERPIGSGNAFSENGAKAGRWDFKKWQKITDSHSEVAQPPANRTEELEQRNAALEQELAALRAESEVKHEAKSGTQAQQVQKK